jgi:excisionase family DNA binding protein
MARTGDVLNAREAADFLGAHVETVRRLARRGDIPSFKMGKDWRFRKEAILLWADSHHLRNRAPRALIVDDDESMRNLIRRILESEGYKAYTASKGAEGLKCVLTQEIDLVLLDLRMPGMDGPEFLLEVRKTHEDIPVIIVTGYPDSELMTKSMKATGDGPIMLLPKPFTKKQLVRSANMALNGAQKKG